MQELTHQICEEKKLLKNFKYFINLFLLKLFFKLFDREIYHSF